MNNYPQASQLIRPYKPVLNLEKFVTHQTRHKLKRFSLWVALALMVLTLVVARTKPQDVSVLAGILCIFVGAMIILHVLDAFFYSLYVRLAQRSEKVISFPLAATLDYAIGQSEKLFTRRSNDAGVYFSLSFFGYHVLTRLGVPYNQIDFSKVEKLFTWDDLEGNEAFPKIKNLADYVQLLFRQDTFFADIVRKVEANEQDAVAAASWVEKIWSQQISAERWWSREHFARIPGLGKDWAYGQTNLLEEYGYFVEETEQSGIALLHLKEIENLESALSRAQAANALVLGDSDAGRMAVVKGLSAVITEGHSHPAIEHKKVFVFQSARLAQSQASAVDFENELTRLFNQAIKAGNIIFVIDNFAGFLASAKNLGVSLAPLLVPYLRSSALQTVALADTASYYNVIEGYKEILEHFETVRIATKDSASILDVAEDQASRLESEYGVTFTYQAIRSAFESAERYFSSDSVVDKTNDLLAEIAPVIRKKSKTTGAKLVLKSDVLSLVESKTGIQLGQSDTAEKDKLLNLESILHQRVIGQDEAVKAISQALRRARSGLTKENRPTGSFLFLGPTGVGKTETAKALSDVFFGEQTPMIRFDMSEYAGVDGLVKLIGDAERGGTLVTSLREHRYGVLLLDEFEKASTEVHNLFLQILDEGFFSDTSGTRVNARNLIIIATSNAGSDLIINLLKDLQSHKDQIINEIIARGIFKPELLNRFDGTILFHPLSNDQLSQVAQLQLNGLVKRLREKGIELVITGDLIKTVIERGSDQRFGARPMNRAIADLVEEKIAQALIKGEVKSGDKISFEILVPTGELNIKKL
ncbi:MAG: AAA family ATPase [Candidatus Pacebacteria bacterium]|nr:AAA family ATPase [Candidatus Paceibacterota bacterium]